MRAAKFYIVLALLASAYAALAEPKAYDLIKYRGKAEGLTIAFDYASARRHFVLLSDSAPSVAGSLPSC